MKTKIITIVAYFCIISCQQQIIKEELLAGKEYKYWIKISNNQEDSIIMKIDYFDRNYNNLGYHYNTKQKQFYMPEFDDVFYVPYWKFVNDTLINIGGENCVIQLLTEQDFIYFFRGKKYHYHIAPQDIIPKEYQQIQSLPKELYNIQYDVSDTTIVLW